MWTPVLSVLHDTGLLNFCTDIVDWNEELILQFYATLHITGDADDVNSWVFDWMTENTHYKAPASELLHALPISPPPEGARCMYQEPELTDHYMQGADEAIETWSSLKDKIPHEGIAVCTKDSLSHSDKDHESNQRPRLI